MGGKQLGFSDYELTTTKKTGIKVEVPVWDGGVGALAVTALVNRVGNRLRVPV
jgi:hypothetical protein